MGWGGGGGGGETAVADGNGIATVGGGVGGVGGVAASGGMTVTGGWQGAGESHHPLHPLPLSLPPSLPPSRLNLFIQRGFISLFILDLSETSL